MLGFILFGGFFGAYTAYHSYLRCSADREIMRLTAQLEKRGVILVELDGTEPKDYIRYLQRMHQLQDIVDELTIHVDVFGSMIESAKTQFYTKACADIADGRNVKDTVYNIIISMVHADSKPLILPANNSQTDTSDINKK